MNNKNIIITIDDGHPADLKIADWCLENNVKAIFYIPIRNTEGLPVLKKNEIKELSKNFEIGAHTYSHIDLTTLDYNEASNEIVTGKNELESIIGKEIKSFAPPRGHFDKKIIDMCYGLGFRSFRSARLLDFNKSDQSQAVWHPNLHIYPHHLVIDLLHCFKEKDPRSISMRLKNIKLSHLELYRPIIELNNEIHLWGHGWEIEKYNINLDELIK